MLIAWPAVEHAVVIAVGPHDRSSTDIYALLLDALDLDVPEEERNKPPCCDEEDRPPADSDIAQEVAGAVKRLGRTRRRA